MKNLTRIISIILIAVGILSLSFSGFVYAKAQDVTLKITMLEDNLSNIYTAPANGSGYRYGPAIIKNENGIYEALFSTSPSEYRGVIPDLGNGAADIFTYRTSSDGGKTWSNEVVSLIPTDGSLDTFSVCDPGLIKYGDWYYVTYTSTFDATAAGVYNHVFAARTKTPAEYKSWQKWNGNGWSDYGSLDIKPIISYYGSSQYYGIGEPSMVIVEGKLYIYYTFVGNFNNGNYAKQTRLTIGSIEGENWPLSLQEYGVVMDNKDGSEDALNVKYVDELDMFISLNTYARMTRSSRVKFMISKDGLDFTEVNVDSSKTIPRLHNAGISGDQYGHLSLKSDLFVLYAYAANSKDWGRWSTAVQFFDVEVINYINLDRVFYKNVQDKEVDKNIDAWALSNVNEYDSEVENWYSADKVVDNDINTYYYSTIHTLSYYNEALAIRTNKSKVKGVIITPTENGTCFPVKFKLQYSNDSSLWYDIEGMNFDYSADQVNSSEAITFNFNSSIKAKYIRILASELSEYLDLYAMQIAEMKAF